MNSKQVNETVKELVSFMQDVKDGNLRTILENMQKMNDYMAEKLRIYEEHLTLLTGKARLELGCVVNRFVLYYANVKKGYRENGECIRTT